MKVKNLHPWDVSPQEAIRIQHELQRKIRTRNALGKIKLIAGADAAFSKRERTVYGAVCLCSFPDMKLLEVKTAAMAIDFPYIPGFLTFREGPVLLECFRNLEQTPDIVIFDGQGSCNAQENTEFRNL